MASDVDVVRLKGERMMLIRVLAAIVVDHGGDIHVSKKALLSVDAAGLENAPANDGDGVRLHYNPDWEHGA